MRLARDKAEPSTLSHAWWFYWAPTRDDGISWPAMAFVYEREIENAVITAIGIGVN